MAKKTSSYIKKIKVISWYCFVKRECDAAKIKVLVNRVASIEGLLNGAEGRIRTKYRNDRRNTKNSLRTLSAKKFGASTPEELGTFIKEKDIKKHGVNKDGIHKSPFSEHYTKDWKHFVQGQNPSETMYYTNTLTYIDNLYPLSSSFFHDGPQLIFRVFETHDFKSAVEAFVNCIAFTISENTMEKLDPVTGEHVPNLINKKWASELFHNLGFYEELNLSAMPVKTRLDLAFQTLGSIRSENPSFNPFLLKHQLACLKLAYYFIKAKYDGDVHGLAYNIFVDRSLESIQEEFGIRADSWFDIEGYDEFWSSTAICSCERLL